MDNLEPARTLFLQAPEDKHHKQGGLPKRLASVPMSPSLARMIHRGGSITASAPAGHPGCRPLAIRAIQLSGWSRPSCIENLADKILAHSPGSCLAIAPH